jgi:hypothetical protein
MRKMSMAILEIDLMMLAACRRDLEGLYAET